MWIIDRKIELVTVGNYCNKNERFVVELDKNYPYAKGAEFEKTLN